MPKRKTAKKTHKKHVTPKRKKNWLSIFFVLAIATVIGLPLSLSLTKPSHSSISSKGSVVPVNPWGKKPTPTETCPLYGSSYKTYCSGTNNYESYANGSCGTTKNAIGICPFPSQTLILPTSPACAVYGSSYRTYCSGTTKYESYANGGCGITTNVVGACAPSAPPSCPTYGSNYITYCSDNTLREKYNNGTCGTNDNLVASCATKCATVSSQNAQCL